MSTKRGSQSNQVVLAASLGQRTMGFFPFWPQVGLDIQSSNQFREDYRLVTITVP